MRYSTFLLMAFSGQQQHKRGQVDVLEAKEPVSGKQCNQENKCNHV